MTDTPTPPAATGSPDRCADCGYPRKEHAYSGACYGVCGEFRAGDATGSQAQELEALDLARVIYGIPADEAVSRPSRLSAERAIAAGWTRRPSGAGDWRDIRTAPKDGTVILAWCVHPNARWAGDSKEWACPVVTQWIDHNGGGWTWNGMAGTFTHWMPAPEGPATLSLRGEAETDAQGDVGLTAGEQVAQAGRCSCRGSDDYCPCQNVPDRKTKEDRHAKASA